MDYTSIVEDTLTDGSKVYAVACRAVDDKGNAVVVKIDAIDQHAAILLEASLKCHASEITVDPVDQKPQHDAITRQIGRLTESRKQLLAALKNFADLDSVDLGNARNNEARDELMKRCPEYRGLCKHARLAIAVEGGQS